jgi:hypothetical protein
MTKQLGSFTLEYSKLLVDSKAKIDIVCREWMNPILPEVTKTEFQVTTKDRAGKNIDQSAKFSFDASSFSPYLIPNANVKFTIDTPYVQKDSSYSIEIDLPVPMEMTDCYVKITFPKQIKVSQEKLLNIVGGRLMGQGSDVVRTPNSKDLTVDVGKFVVIKGCDNYPTRLKPFKILQKMSITFEKLTNPYAVLQTSPFKIEVFKKWSEAQGLSLKVQETISPSVPRTLYQFGQLEKVKLAAKNSTVQEVTAHTVTFTTLDLIPGSSGSGADKGIKPAFHVYFPDQISRDQSKSIQGSVTITGQGSASISNVEASID